MYTCLVRRSVDTCSTKHFNLHVPENDVIAACDERHVQLGVHEVAEEDVLLLPEVVPAPGDVVGHEHEGNGAAGGGGGGGAAGVEARSGNVNRSLIKWRLGSE